MQEFLSFSINRFSRSKNMMYKVDKNVNFCIHNIKLYWLSFSRVIHIKYIHRSIANKVWLATNSLNRRSGRTWFNQLRLNYVRQVTGQVFRLAPLWCLFWRWSSHLCFDIYEVLIASRETNVDKRMLEGAYSLTGFRVVWEPRLATGAFHLLSPGLSRLLVSRLKLEHNRLECYSNISCLDEKCSGYPRFVRINITM